MKKLTLALLASAALAMPIAVPAMAQNSPQTQKPQAQQQQPQNPAGMKQKPSMQKQSMQQPNGQQSNQSKQKESMQQPNNQQPNQQAANQPISPQQLGRNGVRQVQEALNKDGFHAGKTDGIWGPDTRTALNDFQKSKDIPGQGKLNKQTLSDLGVKVASNEYSGNQNTGNQNNNDAAIQSSSPNQK